MLALVVVGTLIPLHIKRGWRARLNRPNGILLIGFVLSLTLSGYALYYSGSDMLRNNASTIHTALGFLFPAVLLWHIVSGRRSRHR